MLSVAMDRLAVLALLCEEAEKEEQRQNRRFWVHDMNLSRNLSGEFSTMFDYLLHDEDKFKVYFRMSVTKFQQIFHLVEESLNKNFTRFREPISATQRLVVCLRFLSTGDSFKTIAFSFRLGHSTVVRIVHETCTILWNVLQPIAMPQPVPEIWKTTEDCFRERWNFPNCIGAIVGKHVLMQASSNNGSLYYNHKNVFSVVLLGLVDASYKFVIVDVGAYGSNSDNGVFKNSDLGKGLENNTLNVPDKKPLPGTDVPMPHVLVGDEAFPLRHYLLRPYSKAQLRNNYQKRVFNYRLNRARNVIENTFGIITQKFRLYQRRLKLKPENVKTTVLATCVLHNFLKDDMVSFPDERIADINNAAFQPLVNIGGSATSDSMEIRDHFKDYFSGVGKVDWQDGIIC